MASCYACKIAKKPENIGLLRLLRLLRLKTPLPREDLRLLASDLCLLTSGSPASKSGINQTTKRAALVSHEAPKSWRACSRMLLHASKCDTVTNPLSADWDLRTTKRTPNLSPAHFQVSKCDPLRICDGLNGL